MNGEVIPSRRPGIPMYYYEKRTVTLSIRSPSSGWAYLVQYGEVSTGLGRGRMRDCALLGRKDMKTLPFAASRLRLLL